jgi:SAM-dependent methyltransferase
MNQKLETSSLQTADASHRVDLSALKARQQTMWASGDFAVIGTTLQIVGETLCEAVDLAAGSRVLDVACGNGNAALAAARRFCRVVGLDYVPALLARARQRAAADGLPIEFIDGDAEALPFPEASFDVALSTFGVMFAPNQQRVAEELVRVVRPGGTIALANWTPEGFIGRLLSTVGKYVAPPPGVLSPILWGKEARLRELFPGVAHALCISLRIGRSLHRRVSSLLRPNTQGVCCTRCRAAVPIDRRAPATDRSLLGRRELEARGHPG